MKIEEALGLVEEVKNCSLPWDDAHWEAFDIVINYVKDKLNNSDKSISEFDIHPQPKQEWSEEDEKILRTIISDGIRGAEFDMLQIDWLKSLRPQSQWKPSEEYLWELEEAIESAREQGKGDSEYILKELLEQLKQL